MLFPVELHLPLKNLVMRLLLLLPFMLTLSGVAYSQATESDRIVLVPVPGPTDKLPSINHLTPEQSDALTEAYGICIVRVVDPPNTYRWNDGTETIAFAPEVTTVAVCRYDDADGNMIGYMIAGFDKSGGLPSKTKTGLFRKLED
jgi:hypothetical protein